MILNVVEHYLEPHRYYHTFEHITNMLRNVSLFKQELSDKELFLLKLAVLYHDVIFVIGNPNNEEESAQLFLSHAAQGLIVDEKFKLNQADVDLVARMIRDTQKHFPSFDLSKYLIDLDLWTLAGDEEFHVNGKKINQEFQSINPDDYKKGRIAWLQGMLDRDTIFYTEYCIKLGFNAKAKANLSSELEAALKTV